MVEESLFKRLTPESLVGGELGRAEEQNGKSNPNPALDDGKILSKELEREVQPDLIGVPLEEIDPFYKKWTIQTFVVIEKNWFDICSKNTYSIHRFSAGDGCNFLSPFQFLRRMNIYLTTNWIFTNFMIWFVLFNTVDMLVHPTPDIRIIDFIYIAVYFFEFAVKLIARGVFMDPFSCLRIYWNWLDIFILLTFPAVVMKVRYTGVITSVRLLKVIPLLPGLRQQVNNLLSTLIGMIDLMIMLPVTMFVFAVSFLQMYMGVLTNKCLLEPSGGFNNTGVDWTQYAENKDNWYKAPGSGSSSYQLCGNMTFGSCPEGYTCISGYGPNPGNGFTSFDNIFLSYLSVARITTQDFWEQLYREILVTNGSFGVLSFICVFLFVTFPFGAFAFSLAWNSLVNLKGDLFKENADEAEPDSSPATYSCANLYRLCPTWTTFNKYTPWLNYLEYFITFVITFDIICQTFDHHGIDHLYRFVSFLKIVDKGVFVVYVLEFFIKILLLSPKIYINNSWHILDFWLLVIWGLTHALEDFNLIFVGIHLLTMLRVFKLVPRLTTVRHVFQIIGMVHKSFRHLINCFHIFLFIFALIGMSLHQQNYYKFLEEEDFHFQLPRWNFDDFWHSYFHVFRILVGDWIETLWDVMFVSDNLYYMTYIGLVVLVGNFLLYNFSAAVILTTIETLISSESKPTTEDERGWVDKICEMICFPCSWINSKLHPDTEKTHDENQAGDLEILHNETSERCRTDANFLGWRTYLQFATSPNFLRTSIVAVCLWIFIAFMEETNDEFVFITNVIFVIYFSVELVVRVIAGGYRHTITAGWIFDLCLILDIVIALCLSSELRLHEHPKGYFYLQCLRPFMLVSRVEGIQAVANGIYKETSLIWKYVFALLFIWLGFGLPALKTYAGSFYKCVDMDGVTPDYRIIKNREECVMTNYTWQNSEHNFDNIGNTFLSLFSVASFMGWLQIQADASDARYVDHQPVREVNFAVFLFFVLFLVFGVFFPLNILFGVLVHHLKKPGLFGIFMTESQRGTYVHREQNPASISPESTIPRPSGSCQRGWYDVVTNTKFETIVVAVICLDLINTSIDHLNAPESLITFLHYAHFFITFLYTVEFFLKIFAWRTYYFRRWINWLDFCVLMDSVAAAIISDIAAKYFTTFQITRPFRIVRVLRYTPVLQRFEKIQAFLRGFKLARSALRNLLLAMITILLTYSLIGNALFKKVDGFERTLNFESTGGSLLITLQIFTMAGWDGIYSAFSGNVERNTATLGMLFLFLCMFSAFILTVNVYAVLILEVINQLKTQETKVNQGNDVSPRAEELPLNNTPSTMEVIVHGLPESNEEIPL